MRTNSLRPVPRPPTSHYHSTPPSPTSHFFFFNDTATTEIYTLSLHDALPISPRRGQVSVHPRKSCPDRPACTYRRDRKSTRLNSSHGYISYAVFCLKKKKNRSAILGRGCAFRFSYCVRSGDCRSRRLGLNRRW